MYDTTQTMQIRWEIVETKSLKQQSLGLSSGAVAVGKSIELKKKNPKPKNYWMSPHLRDDSAPRGGVRGS